MKTILFLLLVLFHFSFLTGQTSTLINPSTRHNSQTGNLLNEESQPETKHLFKINLSPLVIFRPTVAFEQKLGKKFSSETSISYERHSSLFFVSDIFIMDENNTPHYPNGFSYRGYQMFKYYHNHKNRQLVGKSANTFKGSFLAVQLTAIYVDSDTKHDYLGAPLPKVNYYFTFAGLSYGIQWRIANIAYIEPSLFMDIGIKTNFEHQPLFNLGGKLKMGFAIESFASLRRNK